MPVHDWTRVEAGIFHDFHHRWITAISDALNAGLLPGDYYALAEQHAAGFGPDVLTLEETVHDEGEADWLAAEASAGAAILVAPPNVALTAETDMEFYRRKQNSIAVRHVSGDRIVAMVEIVSPGNKNTRHTLRAFVEKAANLLDKQIHLLILDLHPPGTRDPLGIHGVIWDEICDQSYAASPGKPLKLAAYESNLGVRAYVVRFAVGELLTDMPLFLKPGGHVDVPVEATYHTAFAGVPRRWRRVLEASPLS
jgi:Protein of unknown function (DUF4058)